MACPSLQLEDSDMPLALADSESEMPLAPWHGPGRARADRVDVGEDVADAGADARHDEA